MRHHIEKRKCKHCKVFFDPDYRNVERQRYCSQPSCQQASKADSQRRWLQKPENLNHFRGSDNVKRVQQWRKDNPGYWRRKAPKVSQEPDALQDTCMPQGIATQQVDDGLRRPALQDSLFTQPAVLVGLIAQLSGSVLQDDIALAARRLQQLGSDILNTSPPDKGGSQDAKTTPLFSQTPQGAQPVQLAASAPAP